MKKLRILACLGLLSAAFMGCAPGIKRMGYDQKALGQQEDSCKVRIIDSNTKIDPSHSQKVGTLKIYDSGFSSGCKEDDVMKILRNEACSQDANTVLILDQAPPNIWSSCYRVTADIIKTEATTMTIDSFKTDTMQYGQNAAHEKPKSNTGVLIVAFAVSFAVSFVVSYLIFSSL